MPPRRATTSTSMPEGLIYMIDRVEGFDILEYQG